MLYKCANEACTTPFRRLREGRLFQVETEYFGPEGPFAAVPGSDKGGRRVEHYWLCDACSPFVTLTIEKERGVTTVPLPDGSGHKTIRVVAGDQVADVLGLGHHRELSLHEVRK